MTKLTKVKTYCGKVAEGMTDHKADEGQVQQAQARHIHAFLKTAIVFGALAAGTVITVGSLVRRHRVSARAAREALTRLEEDGLMGRAAPGAPDIVADPGKSRVIQVDSED